MESRSKGRESTTEWRPPMGPTPLEAVFVSGELPGHSRTLLQKVSFSAVI